MAALEVLQEEHSNASRHRCLAQEHGLQSIGKGLELEHNLLFRALGLLRFLLVFFLGQALCQVVREQNDDVPEVSDGGQDGFRAVLGFDFLALELSGKMVQILREVRHSLDSGVEGFDSFGIDLLLDGREVDAQIGAKALCLGYGHAHELIDELRGASFQLLVSNLEDLAEKEAFSGIGRHHVDRLLHALRLLAGKHGNEVNDEFLLFHILPGLAEAQLEKIELHETRRGRLQAILSGHGRQLVLDLSSWLDGLVLQRETSHGGDVIGLKPLDDGSALVHAAILDEFHRVLEVFQSDRALVIVLGVDDLVTEIAEHLDDRPEDGARSQLTLCRRGESLQR
mmetsp:Transcript_13956/g.26457  ORF Transcript_13956/g.26457 Transcript_13956/m.26457 type:complete len:340 (+) Transcript_13956:3037-4056(+)